MIEGIVTREREAVVPLTIRGPSRVEMDLEAVIDTGFSDILMVPPAVVSALSLVPAWNTSMTLATELRVETKYFYAGIGWLGGWRDVVVLEAEGSPLLGMALLLGTDLHIQVRDGGKVTIGPGT